MNKGSMNVSSQTNWERVRAMTDEEIATDAPPLLSEDFWERAELRLPDGTRRPAGRERAAPVTVPVTMDADVLAWFQSQGAGCEARMRAALRLYAEAHKAAA